MLKIKINGNLTPIAGVKEVYSVVQLQDAVLPNFTLSQNKETNAFDEEIKWFIYVLDRGSWRLTKGNEKTGATVDYTFTQNSLKWKEMRMIVHAYGQKAMIAITPQKASQGKILDVELLDANFNKPTRPFAYNDWIVARVYCIDMELMPVKVTLWEDDGDKTKQNTANVKIEVKEGTIKNGKADVKFFLNPSHAWLANARLAPGDNDEGEFHEYYVTAEIFEKVSKRVISKNANVPNPDYKTPTPKQPIPAEQKGPSKKDEKGIAKPDKKVHDYYEEKVAVKNEISTNPIMERINSLMTVDMSDWWKKKEEKGVCICKENNFYWSDKLTCDERKKVLEVCANIWGEDKKKDKASELMAIMHLETIKTFSPSKKGISKNGTKFIGLIQFSAVTAKSIGTSYEALGKMTFIEQMKYVEIYLKQNKDKMNTIVDFYLQVIKPGDVGKGNQPDHAVFDESVSVPDGDGSNTSKEQRDKNINREPWVTKYGYASNPTFMNEKDEKVKRKRWVYTRQVYEERYGTIGGKTTIKEIDDVLRNEHYKPGATQLFRGKCDVVEEKKEVADGERAPWMKIAWEEYEKYKGIKEEDSPLKEKITQYFKETGYNSDYKDAWCASFVNWCFNHTVLYKDTNSKGAMGARDWGPEGNIYLAGSGKDGWLNGEITDAFIGAVAVIKSHSHVVFIIGVNSKGDFVNLGGNQGSKVTGGQKICFGSVPKSDVLYIMKPKSYIVTEEEKKLPIYEVDAINDSKSTK